MEHIELTSSDLVRSREQADLLTLLKEDIAEPALHAALLEPWNALASSTNAAARTAFGRELLPEIADHLPPPADFLSSRWLLQSTSTGLAMLLPYTLAGKLAGSGMRFAGSKMGVKGEFAGLLQSSAAAQIIGAGAYDGLRRPKEGESRLGNAAGGTAAFAVFELGNSASRKAALPMLLLGRAATGSFGAVTHQSVAGLITNGELPDRETLSKAAVSGLVMNMVLPEAQKAVQNLADTASLSLGRGQAIDRYIDTHLERAAAADSAGLMQLKQNNPWLRVQTGAKADDVFIPASRVELAGKSGGLEKLARQLARLEKLTAASAEKEFSRAADFLKAGKTEDSWQTYKAARSLQEAEAKHIEDRVAVDLGKSTKLMETADYLKEIGAWPAPAGMSQEMRWRREFLAFQLSRGSYRPGSSKESLPEYIAEKQKQELMSPAEVKELEAAKMIVRDLQTDGEIAVLAGGSVRDELMGRIAKDYDIATSASPDRVQQIFRERGYKVLDVGKQFGTVRVLVDGTQFEITTLRNDGRYTDGRRPESVEPATSLKEDAARRDLTMNAIFKDPLTDTYYDLVGGKNDIAAGKIRAVGDAQQRFAEDRLRMLRVPRFAARYGFEVEPSTLEAIKANSAGIKQVSAERIREEMRGLLAAEKPSVGLEIMMESGLMKEIIPEMLPMNGPKGVQDPVWHAEGTAWVHTKMVVDQLALNGNGKNFPLMMAGVLHDIGKPLTVTFKDGGRISNPQHETVGAAMSLDITQRLKMSRAETQRVEKIIAQHMKMHKVQEMRPGRLVELLKQAEINDLIEMQNADANGKIQLPTADASYGGSHRNWLQAKLAELNASSDLTTGLKAKALVDGHMLEALGFPKTSIRREILQSAMRAQQEGAFSSTPEGRDWLMQNYGQELASRPAH